MELEYTMRRLDDATYEFKLEELDNSNGVSRKDIVQ
jgi:hypothetical protein